MATPTIDLSEILQQLDKAIEKLKEYKKKERINCNALVEELKLNQRLCQLYFDYNGDLDEIVPRLSRMIYDEVLASGFRLKSLRKRKVVGDEAFEDFNMASWQGKPTAKLLRNTYDKLTALVEFYPVAHPIQINPRLRMRNLNEKLLMLIETIDCD